jgi:carboxyl-terminal processing protease
MQNRGVEPDITLPSTWDVEESGESSLDSALPWDEISPTPFRKFKLNKSALDKLKIAHEKRMLESPDLQYILNIRKRYDAQQEKTSISINIDTRRAEKIDRQLWLLTTENQRRAAQNLEIFKTFEDLEEFNENKEDNGIDIDLQNDYLLNEGMLILSDYLYLNTSLLLSEAA